MAAAKKALEDVALLAGTQQNLINLYFLDIYGGHQAWAVLWSERKRTGRDGTERDGNGIERDGDEL